MRLGQGQYLQRCQQLIMNIPPTTLQAVSSNMLRRAQLWIQNGGRHFQHFL